MRRIVLPLLLAVLGCDRSEPVAKSPPVAVKPAATPVARIESRPEPPPVMKPVEMPAPKPKPAELPKWVTTAEKMLEVIAKSPEKYSAKEAPVRPKLITESEWRLMQAKTKPVYEMLEEAMIDSNGNPLPIVADTTLVGPTFDSVYPRTMRAILFEVWLQAIERSGGDRAKLEAEVDRFECLRQALNPDIQRRLAGRPNLATRKRLLAEFCQILGVTGEWTIPHPINTLDGNDYPELLTFARLLVTGQLDQIELKKFAILTSFPESRELVAKRCAETRQRLGIPKR